MWNALKKTYQIHVFNAYLFGFIDQVRKLTDTWVDGRNPDMSYVSPSGTGQEHIGTVQTLLVSFFYTPLQCQGESINEIAKLEYKYVLY